MNRLNLPPIPDRPDARDLPLGPIDSATALWAHDGGRRDERRRIAKALRAWCAREKGTLPHGAYWMALEVAAEIDPDTKET